MHAKNPSISSENLNDLISSLEISESADVVSSPNQLALCQLNIQLQDFDKFGKITLMDLAGPSQPLQNTANSLHSLLSEDGVIRYTLENRQMLENGIVYFISDLKGQIPDQKPDDLQDTSAPQTQDSIINEDLYGELKVSKEQNISLQTKVRDMSGEISDLRDSLSSITQKFSNFRKEHDSFVRNSDANAISAEDKNKTLSDRIESIEYEKVNMKSQLDNLNSELSNSNAEIIKLKSKLESKDRRCALMENQLRESQKRAFELETSSQDIAAFHKGKAQNSSLTARSEGEDSELAALQKAKSSVLNLLLSSSSDLEKLHTIVDKSAILLQKQSQLLLLYDTELSRELTNSTNLKEALSSMEKRNSELTSQLSSFRPPNGSVEGFISDGSKCNQQNTEKIISSNARLVAISESLLRLLSQIIFEGKISPITINTSALNEDKELKTKLMESYSQCQHFLEDLKLPQLRPKEELDTIDREEFAIRSYEILEAASYESSCQRMKNDVSMFYSAFEKLGFSGNAKTVTESLISELTHWRSLISEASKYVAMEKLVEFAKESKEICEEVSEGLAEDLGIIGTPLEIINKAREFINSSSQPDQQSKLAKQLQSEISQLIAEASEEREKSTNYISSLEQALEEKAKEIADESSKATLAEAKIEELEAKLTESTKKCEELKKAFDKEESIVHQLSEEAEHLRESANNAKLELEKASKDAESKAERSADGAKRRAEAEVQSAQIDFENTIKKYDEKLKAKAQKISLLKAKIRDLLKTYDATFRYQRERVDELKESVKRLANELEEQRQKAEEEKKKALGADERLQKLMNASRIEKIDQKAISAAKIERDNFWSSIVEENERARKADMEKQRRMLEEEKETMMKRIGSSLPTREITESGIVEGIRSINERCYILEAENMDSKREASKSKKKADEWSQWAEGLMSAISDARANGDSEIREGLKEAFLKKFM